MGFNFVVGASTMCWCRGFGQGNPILIPGIGSTAEFMGTCAYYNSLDPSFRSAVCQDVTYSSGACLTLAGAPCALV